MKPPRISIWLPLVGLLISFAGMSVHTYLLLSDTIEDNAVTRKTPDSLLFKKIFTSPVPSDVADEYIRKRIISDAIRKTHNNTLVSVYQLKDGDRVLITDNADDIPGKIPPAVRDRFLNLTREWEANGDGFKLRSGYEEEIAGVKYHLIGQSFPLKRGEPIDTGQVLLMTNLDTTLAKTREIFINAKLQTALIISGWLVFALIINVVPIVQLTRKVKRGQSLAMPWWVPQQVSELAAQLTLDREANDTFRAEVATERRMVEIAPVMLVRCKLPKLGKQAIFTYVNPAVQEQLGWDGLIGQPLNTIVPPEYGGYHTWMGLYDEELNRDVGMGKCPMSDHGSRVLEAVRPVQAVTAIGDTIDILLSVQRLPMDEDGSLNFAATMVDISALVAVRKAEQAAMQEAKAARGALEENLVMWRHDILSSAMGAMDMLSLLEQQGFAPPEEYEKMWQLAVKKSQSVYYLVRDTREALTSDLESSLNIKPVPVCEFIDDIIRDYTGNNVVVSTMPDVSIAIDQQQFRRALTNLINNAIRYSNPPNEYVEISFKPIDGQGVFLIKDNGLGIREEDQPRVLEGKMGIGVRLHPHIEGTGLGLYSSKKIAEALGGRCKLIKSVVNQGSLFAISAPISQP